MARREKRQKNKQTNVLSRRKQIKKLTARRLGISVNVLAWDHGKLYRDTGNEFALVEGAEEVGVSDRMVHRTTISKQGSVAQSSRVHRPMQSASTLSWNRWP